MIPNHAAVSEAGFPVGAPVWPVPNFCSTFIHHLVQTWSPRCGQARIDRFIDLFCLSCKCHFTSWTGVGQPERVDEPVNAGPIHILGSTSAHAGNEFALPQHGVFCGATWQTLGPKFASACQIPPIVDAPKENLRLVWLSACNFAFESVLVRATPRS